MSVYWDGTKKRWRYAFNRIVERKRYRASKLLPKGWSKTQAEAYDRKRTSKLFAVASGIQQPERLIDDAVALYLKHRVPQCKGRRGAFLHLAAILPYYEGRSITDLPEVAREYAEGKHKHSSGTVHNRLVYLKAACRYAWKRHWRVGPDPTAMMEIPPANNERQVYLTVEQLKVLLSHFRDKEAADLFKIAFYTGLRWTAELLPRKASDVRVENGQTWLCVGVTKNGSPRMVPIHPAIRGCLKRLPFANTWNHYHAEFRWARKKAGMTHVRPHDLRHSLASNIISRGGSLADVQGALHHKSAASAKRYAHLYPERLRKVILSVK